MLILTELTINLLHELLRPLNAGRDQLVRPWASLGSAEQIISGLHVQTGENRCHDPEHSSASFVHDTGWYHVRSLFAYRSEILNKV